MTPAPIDYSSPNKFSFRQKCVLWTAPTAAASVFKAIGVTCSTELIGMEYWDQCTKEGKPVAVAFWHETLGLTALRYQGTGYHTLTSYSFDGELAARVMRAFGLKAVRGSSSRGGFKALGQLEAALRLTPTAGFTLDGPRGPRRVAKPGIAILAARLKCPILPSASHVSGCWRLNTWDRLLIPKPFSKILCAYGPPIPPPDDTSAEKIEATRLAVEAALNRLHTDLETAYPTNWS